MKKRANKKTAVWHKYEMNLWAAQALPEPSVPVLLLVKHKDPVSFPGFIIVLGYLRFAAGDKNSPQFIHSGATQVEGEPIAWLRCSDACDFDDLWKAARDQGLIV